jgi:putative tryptophan/tyrosine transport system substrate-binding protein
MGPYRVRRRARLVVLIVLVLPLLATAQQPVQVRRIAFLEFGPPPSVAAPRPLVEAFQQAQQARGWVEGHNLAIEWRWTEGTLDQFATLVAEVIRLQVEVIVVPTVTAAIIAQKATRTIPIVVMYGGGLATSELIASLARPGGNVTGRADLPRETLQKRLELLKEALPGVTRVAVLRGLEPFTQELPVLEVAAQSLGVELHRVEAREPTAFDSAFAAMTSAQAQALFVLGGASVNAYRQRIVDLAAQQQLPVSCPSRRWVEAGCLMSYGPNVRDIGPQIAAYVDKILRGASPADLPVEQPMRFEFVVNLKTAQTLGLTLPAMVLFQADEIIR